MSTQPQPLIAIAGGGISGLATALALEDLARARALPAPRLLLLEGDERLGGKIRTIKAEGFACEWGVNGFLNKEPRTLELCQRLGLEEELLPASGAFAKRYIFTRGKLRPVRMHPLRFLFSGILPLRAKLRLVRELWVRSTTPEDSDESVAEFARRRVGEGAYRVLVDPMQTGIYAGDPERMSVLSCFPRVVEVERQYGGLIRGMAAIAKERRAQGQQTLPGAGPTGHLTSFHGGMQTLVDRLAAAVGDGDRIRLGARVTGLRPVEGPPGSGFSVAATGLDAVQADAVVLACPAFEAAAITEGLDRRLAAQLRQIPYSPLAVVCFGFAREQMPHPLDGFGFLVPRQEGLRLLGALWTSTLFPERVPEGQVLVRVMIGGARDPDVLDLDDGQLAGLVLGELRRIHGAPDPGFVRIFRHRQAIPQYEVGHAARLAAVEGQLRDLPGLFITGNAYHGIGVNDCARNAWVVAEQVLGWLTARS
jgi:oxygen-dependent protoporphyrinogen oxidase